MKDSINLNQNIYNLSFTEKDVNDKKPYLEAKRPVKTTKKVKPLPPKGHLIHDSFDGKVKYFFKDIGYDMKSLKDGVKGDANDHELGRLNNVGLRLGGIMIATYLASKTTDPKARLMEYIGLGAFLAAISMYPKIAINKPAKIVHGFDIDKEYIDDQGRKKSVFQDSNYIPYDMYRAEIPEEDLAIIGDKLGIPRDAKNRDDLTREQMRKIATQNNTLWMLTAGFATPLMTALICCGLERLLGPVMESARNAKFNNQIQALYNETLNISTAAEENFSATDGITKKVSDILSKYESKEVPEAEIDKVVNLITKNSDSSDLSNAIKTDIKALLTSENAYSVKENLADEILANARKSIDYGQKIDVIAQATLPDKEVLKTLIEKHSNNGILTENSLEELAKDLENAMRSKAQSSGSKIPEGILDGQIKKMVQSGTGKIKEHKATVWAKENINKVLNLSSAIENFNKLRTKLDKCQSFKIEFTHQTLLARYYEKFGNELFNVLGIKYKDLKKMRDSEQYTYEILTKKFEELTKDSAKYEKAVSKLGKIMADMDEALNGGKDSLLTLINATANNYNKTAERLCNVDKQGFRNTIQALIGEDISPTKTPSQPLEKKEELFKWLDGMHKNITANPEKKINYVEEISKGKGSARDLKISKIRDRYQNTSNIFNRILHTMDFFNRAAKPEEISPNEAKAKTIIEKGKETLLKSNVGNHFNKLDIPNAEDYKDVFESVWRVDGDQYSIETQGYISDATNKALGSNEKLKKASIKERLGRFIAKMRKLIENDTTDFQKPKHIQNESLAKVYEESQRTKNSLYNLVAQSPSDLAKGVAERKYGTQKWLRIIGALTAGVFSATLLTQFTFGKIRNAHNIQRQVKNDSSK